MGATVYLTRYGDYDLSNIGVRYRKKSDLYNRAQVINNSDADMYISTHFMTLHSGIVGKKKKKINGEIIAYNPDHNTHGWWDRRADLFITNNPDATKEAIHVRKMKADKVNTVDFMARQIVIDTNESKEFYREIFQVLLLIRSDYTDRIFFCPAGRAQRTPLDRGRCNAPAPSGKFSLLTQIRISHHLG